MKRLLLFSVFIIPALFSMLSSCDDKSAAKDGIPGPVTELKAESSYGRVTLSWKIPDDEYFYYTKVEYANPLTGASVEKYSSFYSADQDGYCELPIDGFMDLDEHLFSVTTYSLGHKHSEAVTVMGSALEPLVDIVQKTVEVKPDFMGALISWENETGIPVIIRITYKDRGGVEQIMSVRSSVNGRIRAGNMPEENHDLRVIVYDNAEVAFSETLRYPDLEPLPETPLDNLKPTWTVVSEDPPMDVNTGASQLIDGTLEQMWHTMVHASFPFSAVYDLKKEMVITNIGFYRRTDAPWGPSVIRVELSADNVTWHSATQIQFDPLEFARQPVYPNQSLYAVRYIKVTMVANSGEPYAYLAEMEVSGGTRQ